MTIFHKIKLVALCACLAFPAIAVAETFSFSQSGFSEGAIVTMSFTGTDDDSDGQIASFTGEVTDFTMSFSGNSIVPAFSLSFPELFGLVYDLDGGPLGDGQILGIEGVGATGAQFEYVAGPGPVGLCGIGQICAIVSDPANEAEDTSTELLILNSQGFGSATPIPTLSEWSTILLSLLFLMIAFVSLRYRGSGLKPG